MKKFLTGTLAGTVASFIAAYLIFGLALHSYMASHTMEGVGKEDPDFLWVVIGHVFFSATITYIFLKWAGIKTLGAGLQAGFIIGLLIGLGWDFLIYGVSNMYPEVTTVIVDGVAGSVVWAIGGGAVGWALGLGVGGDRSGKPS